MPLEKNLCKEHYDRILFVKFLVDFKIGKNVNKKIRIHKHSSVSYTAEIQP